MMSPVMLPCISQVCSLESSFEDDVADYAAAHCGAIELWLTKLENYLKSHTVDEAKQLLADHGITPAAASFQGGLLTSQGDARREAWDLFRRRLDICREIGAPTIVVACDIAGPLSQQDLERAQVSLVEAAQEAGRRGLRAALEFQATSVFGNNLQTAAALVADVGSPHLGICLDAFHWHVGPSTTEDLALLSRDNLFHVQFCDLADTPRELAVDAQRILPGDGDIPLSAVVARLREIGYEGYVSLELMNPQIWRIAALQVGEIGVTALRKVLGIASMDGE